MSLRKKINLLAIPALLFFFIFGSFTKGSLAMTTDEEKKIGKKILLEMEKQVEWVRDPTLQGFINKIGYSIVKAIGPTPFEFKFYLIKAQDPNAFAIPGGYIFVTTGLIVLAENEQEIAGVLSHETSHVTGRHVDQMMERSKKLNLVTLAAVLAGVLVGRGGASSEAVAATAMATSEALTLKYTRENETEADQNGLSRMVKAGYDPNGMITFLNKIYKTSLTSPQIPVYLSTHPAVEDRMTFLENLLQTRPRPKGPFKTIGNFKRIRAKAFVEEREPDMAVNYFGSMVNTNPQDVDGIYGLGLAFKKMGRLDKSIDTFQSGLSLSPKDADLLRELGIVYFLSGKLDQAIGNLEAARSVSALQDADADLSTLYYLGRAYQEKEDLVNALPLFLKVRKEMPEFVDVYLNLGSVYGRMGQKGLSHFYYGKYFKLRGDGKNALLHFRTALEWLEKGSPEAGEVQEEINEFKQAG